MRVDGGKSGGSEGEGRVEEGVFPLDMCNCSQLVIVHSMLQLDYIFRNETLIQEIESKPIQKLVLVLNTVPPHINIYSTSSL